MFLSAVKVTLQPTELNTGPANRLALTGDRWHVCLPTRGDVACHRYRTLSRHTQTAPPPPPKPVPFPLSFLTLSHHSHTPARFCVFHIQQEDITAPQKKCASSVSAPSQWSRGGRPTERSEAAAACGLTPSVRRRGPDPQPLPKPTTTPAHASVHRRLRFCGIRQAASYPQGKPPPLPPHAVGIGAASPQPRTRRWPARRLRPRYRRSRRSLRSSTCG